MLNKEEIKNKINLKDRTKYAIEKSKNIIKEHKEEKGDCSIEVSLAYDMQYVEEYIDNLESDKQKLIEKLEEDKETLKKESADGTLQDYVIRLLEILKGENQVTVK
jgi:hypothetical protein